MEDAKKNEKANLERRRTEMFLIALVLVLSAVYCVLEWEMPTIDDGDVSMTEDIIENIDFDKIKNDLDMAAAVSQKDVAESGGNIVVTATRHEETELLAGETEDSGDGTDDTPVMQQDLPAQQPDDVLRYGQTDLVVAEQIPEFPGGAGAFMKWITDNLKYPKAAQDNKIQGKTVVSFIIDAEGNVTKLRLVQSSNRQLGLAVLGVMGKMPKWKPGIQDGRPCATMITVPIIFAL